MGGRPPETTDREILEIFSNSKDPVLSTTEVADQLSYSQPGTYSRLAELRGEGLLYSKDIGNAKAWWLTDNGQLFLEDSKADFAGEV